MTQTMEPAKDWKEGYKIYLGGGGRRAVCKRKEQCNAMIQYNFIACYVSL